MTMPAVEILNSLAAGMIADLAEVFPDAVWKKVIKSYIIAKRL